MYSVDANNVIIRIDGKVIERDVHSHEYQQYLYWDTYGKYLSKPQPVEAVEEIAEEEPEIVEMPATLASEIGKK